MGSWVSERSFFRQICFRSTARNIQLPTIYGKENSDVGARPDALMESLDWLASAGGEPDQDFSHFSNPFSDFKGLTSARLRRSGRKNSCAKRRIWPDLTSLNRCLICAAEIILP